MRPARRVSPLVLGTSLAIILLIEPPAHAVQWLHDLDAAKQKAKQQHKVLLVDFYADWCAPCRAMDAQVWNQPGFASLTAKFVCVRLDFDREKTAAEFYEVKGIPTMLFIDASDNKMLHVLGYRPAAVMRAIMQPFPESTAYLEVLFERTKQEPGNYVLKLELADCYRQGGMYLSGSPQKFGDVFSSPQAASRVSSSADSFARSRCRSSRVNFHSKGRATSS